MIKLACICMVQYFYCCRTTSNGWDNVIYSHFAISNAYILRIGKLCNISTGLYPIVQQNIKIEFSVPSSF